MQSFSPLSLAALRARHNIVNQLLDRRASLSQKDGSSALLHMASFTGDVAFIKLLLLKDAIRQQVKVHSQIELRNVAELLEIPHAAEVADGCVLAMHVAAFCGRTDLVEYFLTLGVDVDAFYEVSFDRSILFGEDKIIKESKWTSLMAATRNGHYHTVSMLLGKGGNGAAQTSHNETVLTMATVRGHVPCALALVEWHKERGMCWDNLDRWTPIKAAAVGCHVECARLLVEEGANLNVLTGDTTALMNAAAHGYTEYVIALIGLGADLEITNKDGATACHFAVSEDRSDCLKALAAAGADLNSCNVDGDTPLALAASFGKFSAMRTLFELGAKQPTFNLKQRSAVHVAAIQGKAESIETLHELGADIDIGDERKGQTALMFAALYGRLSCVEKILSIAPQACLTRDRKGGMAIHKALAYGEKECAETLMEHGADINQIDGLSKTPLDWLDNNDSLIEKEKRELRLAFVELGAKTGKELEQEKRSQEE